MKKKDNKFKDLNTWCKENGEYGQQLLSEWTGYNKEGNTVDKKRISLPSNQKVLLSEWKNLNKEPHTVDIRKISYMKEVEVKWVCSVGHEWYEMIQSRTSKQSKCPICCPPKQLPHKPKNIKKANACMYLKPREDLYTWCKKNGTYGKQLIREWTGLNIHLKALDFNNIKYTDENMIWWKCKKGHYWFDSINHRISSNSTCPYCQYQRENGLYYYEDRKKHDSMIKKQEREERRKEKEAQLAEEAKGKRVGGTSYPEQYLYHAIKQIYTNAENRKILFKSEIYPRGLEFDIFIPSIKLCIEYSPTYWHLYKMERDCAKSKACKENDYKLIYIREDSDDIFAETFGEDYICFSSCSGKKFEEKLNRVLDTILKSLNHSLSEVDTEKAKQDAQASLIKS